jgi:threonine/homoserine/homoserine lactone efflux protein
MTATPPKPPPRNLSSDLGSIVNLMFALVDVAAVLLASSVVTRLGRANRIQRAVQQLGGSIMVALGIRLALQKD